LQQVATLPVIIGVYFPARKTLIENLQRVRRGWPVPVRTKPRAGTGGEVMSEAASTDKQRHEQRERRHHDDEQHEKRECAEGSVLAKRSRAKLSKAHRPARSTD